MENTFRLPRQFNIVVYQFFGALLLLFSLMMLLPTIWSLIQWSLVDILIGSVLSLPPLILGAAIIHITQKHIGRVTVDAVKGVLRIKKKGHEDEIHELREIKRFVFNLLILPFPGLKQIVINAEIDEGMTIKLFSDDIVFSGHQWSRFSEKLAYTTNKPLKKDTLIENQHGKLSSE